ncbi:MAG: hypothetical protein JRG90_21015 [Deltaproteobacteria bacterium]|nr:hypothetical protein [Deltaproteobacteria bacterium]
MTQYPHTGDPERPARPRLAFESPRRLVRRGCTQPGSVRGGLGDSRLFVVDGPIAYFFFYNAERFRGVRAIPADDRHAAGAKEEPR